jgi:hypothetical protein
MKRGLSILAFILLATAAYAVSDIHIRPDQSTTGDDFVTRTSFLNSDDDTRLQIYIPELDVFNWHTEGFDRHKSRHRNIMITELPPGTPPGDYLVRFIVSDEDGRHVTHRWITVE